VVAGVLLQLDAGPMARLDFVLQSLGLAPVPLENLQAVTYVGLGQPGLDQVSVEDLRVVEALVRDILVLQGHASPEAVRRRLYLMLVRAASGLRAASEARPTTLRHAASADDMQVVARRQPYAFFFAMEEYDVAWRRFDGTLGAPVTRAAFITGDAVTVLPYDPVRDRVLVVEQYRAGPMSRGDRQCWQIEGIAGRVDPFETPEHAARREAVEEAGLTLTDLMLVAGYYPSTGAVSEYLYSYVAVTDLPDGSAGVFGLESEAEDIRGHLISFDRLMELLTSGEIMNAPLVITALWLQRERPRLRQGLHRA
jgi:nudix-type nucleoside diphosphatase (YffH/AdpP family)